MNKFRTITGFVEQLEQTRNNDCGGDNSFIPEKQINENMQEKIVKYFRFQKSEVKRFEKFNRD